MPHAPPSNLTEGSILAGVKKLALPMVVSMVLNDAIQVVNLIFIGRLGTAHVAGLTYSNVFLELFFMIALGVSTGTMAVISRFVGAGNRAGAHGALIQSTWIGVAFSVVFSVLGLTSAEAILALLGTESTVTELGAQYLRVFSLGSVALFVPFTLNSALRGAGDAITPMKIMFVINLINLALSPLLIFGYLGLPRLEMAGAAWASVISRLVGLVLVGRVLYLGKSYFHLRPGDIKVDLRLMWVLVRIGSFGSLQMIFRNISALVIARLVAPFGVTAMAAFGIVMRLRASVLLPGLAMGTAAAALVGQNLGVGKPERAERIGWTIAGIYAGMMLIVTILLTVFADELIQVFNNNPQVVAEGKLFLRIFASTFVFLAFAIVLGRSMAGAGDTFAPMVITAITLVGLRVPLSYLLSVEMGSVGIWAAIALTNVIQAVLFSLWFQTGRWKKIVIE